MRKLRIAIAAGLISAAMAGATLPNTASASNLCPSKIENAIRAVPRFKNLARPMLCRYGGVIRTPGVSGWSFSNFNRGHWYIGQVHIRRSLRCLACYEVVKVTAFAGHRS